jgi:tetratricopeptide (TPR) repeat protein
VSLKAFIESLDEAVDVDVALLDRITSEAGERSSELRDAIRFCAIPRSFDPEVIGVLRGTPYDVAGNAELLDQLLEYSFVKPREHGGFVYHDHVRGRLLAEWQTDAASARFEELTWELVRHYEAMHEKASQAEDDAARVSNLIRHASLDRYRRLADTLEAGLLGPLIEAAYQLSLISPSAALGFVLRQLERYEDRERYGACRALVAAARDLLLDLPDDAERARALAWLVYWDSRLLNGTGRYDEAERLLIPLRDTELGDDRLRFWVLGELAMVQQSCFKLREALAASEAEVEFGERTQVDRPNLPLSYQRLGELHHQLEDPVKAARYARIAMDMSESPLEPWPMFWALETLAEAELSLGRREEAFATAMRALDVARTELLTRRAPQVAMGEFFSEWFADEDPVLLDTVRREGDELSAGLTDMVAGLRRRISRIQLLRRNGQLKRARSALMRMEREVAQARSGLVQAYFMHESGQLNMAEGRLADAAEAYDAADRAAREAGVPDVGVGARYLRGRALTRLGRSTEAEADLTAAEERWRRYGHDVHADVACAARAVVLRRRGDPGSDELAPSPDAVASAGVDTRATFLELRGDHEAAAGRWESAREARLGAAAMRESGHQYDALARLHADLSELAAAEGRWGEAERHANGAAAAWQILADRARYKRPPVRKAADQHNAEGLRGLLSGDPEAVEAARETLRAAIQRAPGESWYRLNLAYAAATAGDWVEAVEALEGALQRAPRLRCQALEMRLGAFHVARGQTHLDHAEYEAAAESFRDSLDSLTARVHQSARARCYLGLGDSLYRLDDTEGAAEAYRDAEHRGDDSAIVRLGDLLAGEGRTDEAREAYRRGLMADEVQTGVDSALRLITMDGTPDGATQIIDAVNKVRGAAATLSLADGLAPYDPTSAAYAYALSEKVLPAASVGLGDVLAEQGDAYRAREAYRRAMESGDDAAAGPAAARLGDLLVREGDVAGAKQALRTAIALGGDGGTPEASLQLGRLLIDEDPADAENYLRRAAAGGATTTAAEALVTLGELFASTGRHEEARDRYRQAMATGDPDASARAGLALVEMFSPDDGGAALDEAVELITGAGARTAIQIGDLLAGRGHRSTAERIHRAAADLPGDLWAPDAALRLARLLHDRGATAGALDAYRRALESEDPTVVPDAAVDLYKLGKPAADTLDRAAALGDPTLLRLGDLLLQRGERALGEEALRRLASDPESPFAQMAADRLEALDKKS